MLTVMSEGPSAWRTFLLMAVTILCKLLPLAVSIEHSLIVVGTLRLRIDGTSSSDDQFVRQLIMREFGETIDIKMTVLDDDGAELVRVGELGEQTALVMMLARCSEDAVVLRPLYLRTQAYLQCTEGMSNSVEVCKRALEGIRSSTVPSAQELFNLGVMFKKIGDLQKVSKSNRNTNLTLG